MHVYLVLCTSDIGPTFKCLCVLCVPQHGRHLDISANAFTGAVDDAIGNLTSLRSLDIGNNAFSGSLPAAVTKLGNLK